MSCHPKIVATNRFASFKRMNFRHYSSRSQFGFFLQNYSMQQLLFTIIWAVSLITQENSYEAKLEAKVSQVREARHELNAVEVVYNMTRVALLSTISQLGACSYHSFQMEDRLKQSESQAEAADLRIIDLQKSNEALQLEYDLKDKALIETLKTLDQTRRCIWVVLVLCLSMMLFFSVLLVLAPMRPSPSELPTPLPPLPHVQIPPENFPQLPEPSPAQEFPEKEISEKVTPAFDEDVAKEQTIPESRGPQLSEEDHQKSPPKEISEKMAPLVVIDQELARETLEDPKSSVARSDSKPVAPELVIDEVSPRAPTSVPTPKKPQTSSQTDQADEGESWRGEMPNGLVFKNTLGEG